MHLIRVPIKILNLGDSRPAGVLPLILPQRKRLPWIAHWKGTDINKGGTEVHGFLGFLGVWSAEVISDTTSPRQTRPITRQSYPPRYMLQSRNIW